MLRTDIVAISAGTGYTLGLKKDGTVLVVGYIFLIEKAVSLMELLFLLEYRLLITLEKNLLENRIKKTLLQLL